MQLQKLILLNPPFHKPIIRDYNCSHFSKGTYQWAPIDLVVLSANLQDHFELLYFDLIKCRQLVPDLLSEVQNCEILISLVSYISIKEDLAFLNGIKQKNSNLKIYILGDIVLFNGDKLLQEHDFLHGKIDDFSAIQPNLLSSAYSNVNQPENGPSLLCIKPQNAQLFHGYNYAMPYSRYNNVATVLALNYGCKFHCTYCNSNKLQYKTRDVSETVVELKSLALQGVREVYFRDFTLNAEPEALDRLCDQIIEENIKIIWSCDVRIDLLSEHLLLKMKKAGCFLIFFGVETSSNEIARETGKLVNKNTLKQILNICRREGILTLGSFLLGLPKDTIESIDQTINYAVTLKLTYASFNIFEQRPGVDYTVGEQKIPLGELIKYQTLANKIFYLRIHKIFELLLNIKTSTQLKNAICNGLKLIKLT